MADLFNEHESLGGQPLSKRVFDAIMNFGVLFVGMLLLLITGFIVLINLPAC